ncbi:uncharacterized protein LOC135266855 [Tribolium castaneum]|uniref:uncharacterized protein LOC135266855 n=1 Tax=Tribolium castaneum TaxID=7070 RepID=UPI0030FE721B
MYRLFAVKPQPETQLFGEFDKNKSKNYKIIRTVFFIYLMKAHFLLNFVNIIVTNFTLAVLCQINRETRFGKKPMFVMNLPRIFYVLLFFFVQMWALWAQKTKPNLTQATPINQAAIIKVRCNHGYRLINGVCRKIYF